MGLIAGAGLRNEGAPFGVQTAGPSRGSDDHVTLRSRLQQKET